MSDQRIWLTCLDDGCGMRNPAELEGTSCDNTCSDEECSFRIEHASLAEQASA